MRSVMVAVGIIALLASNADACNRCGVFGKGCRVAHAAVAVAAVPVAQVAPESTVVITNVYPNQIPYPVAQQGATLYGLQAAIEPLRVSPELMMNQANRHAELSLKLAEQAPQNYAALASQVYSQQSQTDKIYAASHALAQILNASTGPVSVRTVIEGGQIKVEQVDQSATNTALTNAAGTMSIQSIANTRCVKCHDGTKNGPDLRDVSLLSADALDRIARERLMTDDPEKLMPRGPDKRGMRLSYDELAVWMCDVRQLKASQIIPQVAPQVAPQNKIEIKQSTNQ